MLTQNRKILFSVVAAIGIGFSVLVGASLALTYQPPNMMAQQFSMNGNFPNIGFSGSQLNNMMSNSGQGFGRMNQGMMGQSMQNSMMGSGMNQGMGVSGSGMNPMMQMMSMMMPAMFSSGMNNMQNMPMNSIIPLSGSTNTNGIPLDHSTVLSMVSSFLDGLNNSDLEIGVLSENDNNFYVAIQEKSTGVYAFDLLVDKMTGAIYAEPGPNMVWNTKYGFMPLSGMGMNSNQSNMQSISPMMNAIGNRNSDNSMGMLNGQSPMNMNSQMNSIGTMITKIAHIQVNPFATTMMSVTNNDVMQIAQQFLDANSPSSSIEKIRTYYGYYTIDVSQDGKIDSSLSVNSNTGQMWFKEWHNGLTNQMMR